MSALTELLEQTKFLIEKQTESLEYTTSAFKSFLEAIEAAQQKRAGQAEEAILQDVYSAVADQSEKYSGEIEEDISFLDAQIETIQTIVEKKDDAKAVELVRVLMDGHEVPDTETFK